MIASIVHISGMGDSVFLLFPLSNLSVQQITALFGCLESIPLDFIVRQKVGGTNANFYSMKQFPLLLNGFRDDEELHFIVSRVLELSFTSESLRSWAEDLGCHSDPFPWDPKRRALLRAELDAYYARLYGLNRDELRYILDLADVHGEDYPSETFRVLKDKGMRLYGEYRTRRLVLEAWDRLFEGEARERVAR